MHIISETRALGGSPPPSRLLSSINISLNMHFQYFSFSFFFPTLFLCPPPPPLFDTPLDYSVHYFEADQTHVCLEEGCRCVIRPLELCMAEYFWPLKGCCVLATTHPPLPCPSCYVQSRPDKETPLPVSLLPPSHVASMLPVGQCYCPPPQT